jgi:hypothetical protein
MRTIVTQLSLTVTKTTWLLPHHRYEINDDKDNTMSDLGGDIPMQPPNEVVNTTTKVEGNTSVIVIENILEKVVPSEREWKVHLGTGIPYYTTGCEMCVTFMKHLGEDKERGNISLNTALQWLEKHWLKKLENHPFMNNRRQQAYDHRYDDGIENTEKEQEHHLKKGKGRATLAERSSK